MMGSGSVACPLDAELFPDLAAEQAHLAFSRQSRIRMVERLSAVDPESAADEITKEYIEVTVADAIKDLGGPGAGDFFGRIDCGYDRGGVDRWYVGRRHIEDDNHDPVVVDWRAPIAAPFYRATAVDALGVDFRRRFTLDDGELIAYLDEQLDDPDGSDVAGGIPDPVLAEIGAERSGEMREIVATIQGEQDVVIRSDIDQVLIVQGGPGTGKTAVALHRAAYLMFEHRGRLARDGVLVVGPNRAFLDYIGNVLPSLGERSVRQSTIDDLCIPRVEVTLVDDVESARWKGSADRLGDLETAALAAIQPPPGDVAMPIGARNHIFTVDEISTWLETAKGGTSPINERRVRVTALAKRALLQRTGEDAAWSSAGPLKTAINKAWRTQKPTKLVDNMVAGPKEARLDERRPTTHRRSELAPERVALHLWARDCRRGSGSLRCGVARDRSSQPVGLDDARRRRCSIDDACGPGTMVRGLRPPWSGRNQWLDCRSHHRLPRA